MIVVDEVLERMKTFIYGRLEHRIMNSEDAWYNEDKELVSLYLQLIALEKLQMIDANLDDIYKALGDLSERPL